MVSLHLARRVDRGLGQPLCRLLSLFRFLRRRSIPKEEHIRKFLVIKMWGIGSIVQASPIFRNLKANCPQATTTFLTLLQNRDLYEGSPFVDEVLTFDLSTWRSAARSALAILRWMWRERVDVVLDLEIASRLTAIFCYLSPGSLAVGYAPAGSGKDLFDVTIPYTESIHIRRIFLRSLDVLELPILTEELLPLPISDEDEQEVTDWLEEKHIGPFLALNPNSSDLAPERMWQGFQDLAIKLTALYPRMGLVLIGGPEDRIRVAAICNAVKGTRIVSAAGRFSLRQTTALLARAHVLVSNDSGPMHLGVLADVPTIALFGPETPTLYGPLGKKHGVVYTGEICSPCISAFNDKVLHCSKDAVCMKNITTEAVLARLVEVLEREAIRV